jgi:hypothetical protein
MFQRWYVSFDGSDVDDGQTVAQLIDSPYIVHQKYRLHSMGRFARLGRNGGSQKRQDYDSRWSRTSRSVTKTNFHCPHRAVVL